MDKNQLLKELSGLEDFSKHMQQQFMVFDWKVQTLKRALTEPVTICIDEVRLALPQPARTLKPRRRYVPCKR